MEVRSIFNLLVDQEGLLPVRAMECQRQEVGQRGLLPLMAMQCREVGQGGLLPVRAMVCLTLEVDPRVGPFLMTILVYQVIGMFQQSILVLNCWLHVVSLASAPGPLFILGFERAWYAKIRHVTSFWTGCVHGDASFHHDIVPECLWPSSSLVRVLD